MRPMLYKACYDYGAEALRQAGVPEAELDARLLLEFVCGTDHNTLLVHGDRVIPEKQVQQYRVLIGKRAERIPLQQLTGEQSFCGFSFRVNSQVLIPRQDTELLVELALQRLQPGMRLLDLCTGSGCILISLLKLKKGITGVGTDISKEALAVAQENGRNLLTEQPVFLQGDLFAALPKEDTAFDMLVSNPPYIRSSEISSLMPEVQEHEPRLALDGSEDGLAFYRRITKEAPDHLKEGGWLLLEIGYDQGEALEELLSQAGFTEIQVWKDYAGLDRVAGGRCRH